MITYEFSKYFYRSTMKLSIFSFYLSPQLKKLGLFQKSKWLSLNFLWHTTCPLSTAVKCIFLFKVCRVIKINGHGKKIKIAKLCLKDINIYTLIHTEICRRIYIQRKQVSFLWLYDTTYCWNNNKVTKHYTCLLERNCAVFHTPSSKRTSL